VIVANGSPATAAAKAAAGTIPIVFSVGVDPIGFGFVQSLARPGGNLTAQRSDRLATSCRPRSRPFELSIVWRMLPHRTLRFSADSLPRLLTTSY
jgi:hypothetical protein